MSINKVFLFLSILLLTEGRGAASETISGKTPIPGINDASAGDGEWGIRPENGAILNITPSPFVLRPQHGATTYEILYARDAGFTTDLHRVKNLKLSVHCPSQTMGPGKWFWKFRFTRTDGVKSKWSKVREFSISRTAKAMPLPSKKELLSRIPKNHPRIFIRPEQLPELRKRAKGDLKPQYDRLIGECERLLNNPPPTAEPKLYSPDMVKGDDRWFKLWWDNRLYTINALEGAANLGFGYLISGKKEYGLLAREILLACAKWDPTGATGSIYNDEAGMPYLYRFSRAYSFINQLLSEPEKQRCREVIRIRGNEFAKVLYPRQFFKPYPSHNNRSWHFLCEAGIVFLGEIPEASEWLWKGMNIFACIYPVWCDDDGGWNEGVNYWRSYMSRFTWYADIMRIAMGINAYNKPFFSQVGYYAMYLQPPGSRDGGFGDLAGGELSRRNYRLMSTFASQSGNPYWQWYVDHLHPKSRRLYGGYLGYIRGAYPIVKPKEPTDLPSSRCFRGIGLAAMNSDLTDGLQNVQVLFKSSPFGQQSHAHDSDNTFLLNAVGERLLIRSGIRDFYGSRFHREWMWQTKSVNGITVNGKGQLPERSSRGKILEFRTTPDFDYVAGDATDCYSGLLKEFKRRILYFKPEVIIIMDSLTSNEAASFEWHLHAVKPIKIHSQDDILIRNNKASCLVSMLWPKNLKISQTDRFDPPPLPRIKLTQYHLTAQTAKKAVTQQFITVIRPYRTKENTPAGMPKLTVKNNSFLISVPRKKDRVEVAFTPGMLPEVKILRPKDITFISRQKQRD